jgi:hypothetical protein
MRFKYYISINQIIKRANKATAPDKFERRKRKINIDSAKSSTFQSSHNFFSVMEDNNQQKKNKFKIFYSQFRTRFFNIMFELLKEKNTSKWGFL